MTAAAATVQAFFTERLARQRRASPHTIAAYRDTLRLLLGFAAERAGTVPCRLGFADLAAPVITAFLDHCEHQRGNGIRTRNARLAAIHALFGYASLRHPEHAADIERVLAIPPKRASQTIVTYLTDDEASALLPAPDRSTRTGRRDHAWILLAVQTGLRASELTGLARGDAHLGHGAYIACHGKGRKDRITPLTPGTVTTLRAWLAERGGQPADPLFVTSRGGPLSHDALQQRLAVYAAKAARTCPALAGKKITPHVLRHTAAMRLLHAGTDITVIASGSGTNRSPPPRSTCKPTWPSNSKPSTGPPHWQPRRAATSHPTNCWPFWKPCDYADIPGPVTPAHQHPHGRYRHNRGIGVMVQAAP